LIRASAVETLPRHNGFAAHPERFANSAAEAI
jgi:hypothetical protein